MDQAMGDLQSQLEEMRRMWEQERDTRQRLEAEVQVLKGLSPAPAEGADAQAGKQDKEGNKRPRDGDGTPATEATGDSDDRGKRPRTE